MNKDIVKILSVILAGLIGAAIPVTLFYLLWSYCIGLVPVAATYAGVLKIGITLSMILVGGSATVAAAILLGFLASAFVVAVLDL